MGDKEEEKPASPNIVFSFPKDTLGMHIQNLEMKIGDAIYFITKHVLSKN